jgi:AcrR family transcriptional regulator
MPRGGWEELAVSARTNDGSTAQEPTYAHERLAPGPSGLTREQVASHQRARIYLTMIELVALRGYGALRVRELVRRARVAPHTFYEHFGDAEECFLSTFDIVAGRAAKQVRAAQHEVLDWRERLRVAFLAFAAEIAQRPEAAQLALVEAFAAGPAALERMRRAEATFEEMVHASFDSAPERIAVPPLIVTGVVAGVARVARARLMAGRAEELPELADELLAWTLSLRCPHASAVARLGSLSAPAPPATVLDPAPGEEWGERAQLLDGAARLAALEGYPRLTSARVCAEAGVSRRCLGTHFDDISECFMAAVELLAGRALARAQVEGAAGISWAGGVYRALVVLCVQVAADPAFARLAFVEVFAPGPAGMRCREGIIGSVAEGFRADAPSARRPSEIAAEASVGAVWGIIHRHVAAGCATSLPRAAGLLAFLMLAPAIGGEAACEEIDTEHARMHTNRPERG